MNETYHAYSNHHTPDCFAGSNHQCANLALGVADDFTKEHRNYRDEPKRNKHKRGGVAGGSHRRLPRPLYSRRAWQGGGIG